MLEKLRRTAQNEQGGQVLVLVAALLAVIGGMAALAIDFSSYAADHRELQNDADAMALAASLDLPSSSAAIAAAESWAAKNNIEGYEIEDVEIIPQGTGEPNPRVRVTLRREHEFTFARLIGISSADVVTSAAAIKTSAAGGDGVVPFSVTAAAMNSVNVGDEVVLKYDSDNIQNGNTSPIRIDGSGNGNCNSSDRYCDGVKFGSESAVCAQGADPTYCDGPSVVDTQTGNLIGGTRRAIQYRLDNTDAHCDEFDEVFTDDDGSGPPDQNDDGIYRLANDCNPFTEGGYDSLRVLIVPIIGDLCNGSCEVTIEDFGLFFLEGFANGSRCTGNDCEIIGRFVRVNQNIGLLAGTFDPDSANSFVRLVE
jgi:hypothetical protein